MLFFLATEIKSSRSFYKVMAGNVGLERCKLEK